MNRIPLAVALAVAVAGAVMSRADEGHAAVVSLPDPTTSAICSHGIDVNQGPTSCSITGATAHIDLLPAVHIVAAVSSDGNPVNVGAAVVYSFEVVGPSGTQVPIVIDARLFTSVIGFAGGDAQISVGTDPFDLASPLFNARVTACQNNAVPIGCTGDPAEFNGAINLLAIPNLQATVDLSVLLGAGHDGVASASADPLITIDPTFAGAGSYSIVLSNGVGNALAGVPEPSGWILMILGAGLAGLGLRRGRSATAPAGAARRASHSP